MTNQQHMTITAPDGWRIEYHISQRGFAKVFDARGHLRGGPFNAPPKMVEEELEWFKREHGAGTYSTN
jgi:hypothetical protein